jgi:nitrate/TMAO reductase-like tetraheme cytochrome c subunit
METQDMKVCRRCLLSKPLSDYTLHKGRPDGLQLHCTPCRKETDAAYRAGVKADPVRLEMAQRKSRDKHLRKTFGMTLEQWEEMFEKQDRRCRLCHSSNPQNAAGWGTDHCHSTGRVRGILCAPCNWMLGYLENGWVVPDPTTLREYLK